MAEAYIVAAVRTAGGKKNGRLSKTHPADMGGKVIDALIERTGLPADKVDDVIYGCVSQIGPQTFNVARTSILSSCLPESVPGVSIDRQCGSSQQAIHFAAQAVMSGTQDVIIAGGVESMSQVPIGSPAVAVKEMGSPFDGVEISKRYPGEHFSQFNGAERMAEKYGVSKEELDQFAYDSHKRGAAATEAGRFKDEIIPITVTLEDGSQEEHVVDEGIRWEADLAAIKALNPLVDGGYISAANASQITDGASALMIVSEKALKEFGLTPLARIHAMSVVGSDPTMVLEGPIPATEKVLAAAGMTIGDIDLYEVNEAFGSVPLAWMKAVGADYDKLNVNGGAQALGHPLGGTGTKLMGTLIYELKRRGGKYGLLAICEGLGTANATIIEVL
ncbi:acetyl-CoA acetyltransferase [Alcanivorax sp. P2S70]|uniref:Acetyl-CoA C-acyltransferase n=1 Tax=Alcanivorax profundi TaxID=2338368 RepID=A0A418XUM0_9GAMM|nr:MULTISPECIES: acetyl-CoA C-acetyltransferase [Alcanivorax]ERP90005.1 acetyl-CoA acetyltransferase [Alcanivorax sp. P2S70]RJG16394.1 acetyl-CoA C-acyltransferase [Alcanivorax profundi]